MQIMDLTPKQQTSEAIRQAETILIMTGQHPSVDQVCAVIGLAQILRKFGKKVTAAVSDSMPPAVQLLETGAIDRGLSGMRDFVLKLDVTKAEVDKLRYEVIDGKLHIFITPFKGGFAPSDVTFDYGSFHYDLAIALGVPTRARLDRIYEQNAATFQSIPLVNLDFHRSNENYGAVNLIEPNASSLCEMLVALSESLQGGIIDDQIATTLLMGIVASTDRFTAAHTTSKSLTVAAQMMAAGARQQSVVKALFREGKSTSERGGERPQREARPATAGQGAGRDGRSDGVRNAERPEPRNAERPERQEPRSAERQEPRAERPERTEPRSTERPEQPVREMQQPREAQPVRESQAAREPEAQTPTREETAGATIIRETVVEPSTPRVEPSVSRGNGPMDRPQDRPDRPQRTELPIIDPGHIELSKPEEAEAQLEQEPEAGIPPMADFAAAAEILAHRHDDDNARPEGDK